MSKWNILFFSMGFAAGMAVGGFLKRRDGGIVRGAASSVIRYGVSAKRRVDEIASKTREVVNGIMEESDRKARVRDIEDAG
jgi:hypothetical protein